MKRALLIPLAGVTMVTFTSCGDFGTSLNNQNLDPNTNPLDSPGSRNRSEPIETGPQFTPGTWVEVTDANAGFYRHVPGAGDQADFSLKLGTPLKVVGGRGSYVKIETESGQIGYVPAIMVGTKPAGDELPIVSPDPTGAPPSIEPIDSIDPIDPIDPSGLTPLPDPADPGPGFVAPEPEVPPISVEESPAPPTPPAPVVPPDPVGNE